MPVLLAAAALNAFLFALFLKRRYDIAVVFLTLMVVLLTEAGGPVDWRLTVERLACTLAGGGTRLARPRTSFGHPGRRIGSSR